MVHTDRLYHTATQNWLAESSTITLYIFLSQESQSWTGKAVSNDENRERKEIGQETLDEPPLDTAPPKKKRAERT